MEVKRKDCVIFEDYKLILFYLSGLLSMDCDQEHIVAAK
jgi:hypothetical protein